MKERDLILLSTIDVEAANEIVSFFNENQRDYNYIKKKRLISFITYINKKYNVSISVLCKVFGMARSWYYESSIHDTKNYNKRYNDNSIYRYIKKNIRKNASLSRLGYKKITALINNSLSCNEDFERISEYRIYKILKSHNDFSTSTKNKSIRALFKSKMNPFVNWIYSLYDGNFNVTRPFEILVTDSTYIPCKEYNLYLVVIIDIFGRRVIGYRYGRKMDQHLFNEAFAFALQKRISKERFTILHGDRGSVNASTATREMCNANNVTISYSRVATPTDNPMNESFFSSFKDEVLVLNHTFKAEDMKMTIDDYILTYNTIRPHGALGYLTPKDFILKNNYQYN